MMVVPTAAHELSFSAVKRTYHLMMMYNYQLSSRIDLITYEFLCRILSKRAHSDALTKLK